MITDKCRRFNGPPMAYLSEDLMEALHEASMTILETVGCRVCHPAGRDLLERNGARIEDEDRVYLPPDLIQWAIEKAPDHITIFDRLGRPAMELARSNVYFGTGSDCQYLLDPETARPRDFLFKDMVDAIRLADALPHIDFVMSMGLAPDLPDAVAFQEKYAAILRNTVKPHVIISGPSRKTLSDIVEMAAAAAGSLEALVEKPMMLLLADPTSPLVHSEDAVEKLIFMAEHRLPMVYATGIMAGASSPVTPAGAIAQANAEVLAGLTIHQLTRPGAPFVFGGGMSPLDMVSAQPTYSAPEAMVTQAGLCQLGRSLYRLPTWGFGGCSASKLCDEQAVNEAATYLMASAWMGTNLIHDLGYIEFGRTYSVKLLTLCDEVIGQIRRIMEGIVVDKEHLGLEAIQRVGPGGTFLTDFHTFTHFRRNWQPGLTDRNTRETWTKKGGTTMGERAGGKIAQILASHEPVPLDAGVENRIQEIIRKAARRTPGIEIPG